MKSKSVVLMIVSLGFGLIAAIGISQVMGNNSGAEPKIKRGQVIVAAVDLNHGDDLTEETCKIEHWPLEVIPENAARSFEEIQHKKIATRLSKSLPIMMTDTKNASEIDKVTIPKGFKLVAIKVSAEDSIAGLLRPGDHVDVIGVVQVKAVDPATGKVGSQTVSETFLKNIEVYAVNGNTNSGGPRESSGNGSNIIGVLVSEKQSELIVLVQKVAKLRLVMRGEHDDFDDEENEINDYNDFYESVYGKEGGDLVDKEPEDDTETQNNEVFTTRVWTGDTFEEVKFRGKKRVTSTDSGPSATDLDDSDEYNQSDEIGGGLEEDQYPGE